jgi:hypothetical protein
MSAAAGQAELHTFSLIKNLHRLVRSSNYGGGRGVGRTLGVGIILGVGVARGVGVAVGVAVGVGVGVGVAPDCVQYLPPVFR